MREGATDHATGLGVVKSLYAWNSVSGTTTIFGFTDTGAFNVTAAGAVGAASTVLTSGKVLAVNFRTSGVSALFIVNGVDDARYYDGAAWTTTASYALSGGGTVNSNTFVNIAAFKRRLFFIEKDSMNFCTLPLDSIAGTMTRFPLGGLFDQGGYLMAMGTWTVDGGQGVDDYAAFITSKGQIAIYKGTDPTSSTDWALQGVFYIGVPLGRKCFAKYGGDLLALTSQGIFPLSKALQSATVTSSSAISDTISGAFTSAAATYGSNYGWEIAINFSKSQLLVNVPKTEFSDADQYVMNTITGAWCKYTGWDAFSWVLVGNQLYMGLNGKTAKALSGLNDFGSNINAYAKGAFDYLGNRAQQKHIKLSRPALKIAGQLSVDLAVDVDFANGTDYGPSIFVPAGTFTWDAALWDSATWADVSSTRLNWVTAAVSPGYCAAPRLRVIAKDATVAWSATDFAFERGGLL